MKKGSVGPEVKNLQNLLNLYFGGSPLEVDGHFGPKTEYYLKQFQKKSSLPVTGIADDKTLSRLANPSISPSPTKPPEGYYPSFAKVLNVKMPERGSYSKGSPLGAIVHFTAGRDGAEKTINGGIKNGYTFWCIQRDGTLMCAHRYDKWGYHAGESRWTHLLKKLVGKVSDDLIGIEINAYGKVTPVKGKPGRYVTWFNLEIGQEEVRYTPGGDNQLAGYYHVYTDAQVETLTKTLLWLKSKNPEVFDFDLVLGHDEVSGKSGLGYWRKNDPGAALPMTMPKYREYLKSEWLKLNQK